jgi:hypothetical protein
LLKSILDNGNSWLAKVLVRRPRRNVCFKWSHDRSTSFYRLLTFPGRLSSNHLNSMMQQSTRRLMLWQYMLCPWSCSGSIIIKASGSDKLFEKLLFNSPLVISLNLQKRCQRKEVTLSKKRKNYNRYFLSTVSLFLLA